MLFLKREEKVIVNIFTYNTVGSKSVKPPVSGVTSSAKGISKQKNSNLNALGDIRKQDKEDIVLRKAPKVDIDKELSIISQEMSFIDPSQKRDSKELAELKPDGKFKIPNKDLSKEEKKERYDPIVYVIIFSTIF